MLTDAATGIVYRENSFDEWILKESRSYFPLELFPNDRVLDLGGHIGCFASRAMKEMPGIVLWSYEPEQSNFSVLKLNANTFGFTAFNQAVVKDELEGEEIKIYVNEGTNNALHSTIPTRGRSEQSCPGQGLIFILNELDPTLIKCDIEGGEYDLPWEEISSSVRYVVMELHLTRKDHRGLAAVMLDRFKELGFKLENVPNIGQKNWTTMAKWRR